MPRTLSKSQRSAVLILVVCVVIALAALYLSRIEPTQTEPDNLSRTDEQVEQLRDPRVGTLLRGEDAFDQLRPADTPPSASKPAEPRTQAEPRVGDELAFDWRKPSAAVLKELAVLKADIELDSFERKRRKAAPGIEFRRLSLQDEKGQIPVDGLQKAKQQMDRMRAAQEARSLAEGQDPDKVEMAGLVPADWSWLGPGNVGGRIRSILIDPSNANNIWVGSVGGGIWRSTNGGTSWQPVNDFMANLAVSTMAINPADPTVMYAGTGEGFGNVDALGGGGIFQSTDSGATWNLLAGTDTAAVPTAGCDSIGSAPCPATWQYVNRVAVSGDGSTVLAATRSGDNNNDGNWDSAGIQRLAAGNWTTRANTFIPVDIKFDPTNSSLALAGGLGRAQWSNDGGVNWNASTFFDPANPAGTTTITPLSAGNNGRVELAYAPSNPQIVYAAVNNNNGDLYRSTDGGQNFTRVNTGTNVFLGALNQGWYDNVVWVNPQDPTFVIVGGIELWRSTDCGTINPGTGQVQCNLAQVSNSGVANSVHADHHAIVAHPGFNNTTNRTVFLGNDGGIYKADDVATALTTCDTSVPPNCTSSGWTELNNNLGITQFYGGAVTPSGTVFGGTQDNGTLRIVPTFSPTIQYDSENWSQIAGSDGGYVAADPTDGNYLYGERQNMAIFRSTDGGNSETTISGGITDRATANFIAPLILDPNNPNTLLAGSVQLWRSTDVKTSANWTVIKGPNPTVPPGPAPTPTPSPNPISAITVAKGNSDFVLVGHNDGQIYISQNGTDSPPTDWALISNGTPARFVTRLVIDDNHAPAWIYATFGGFSNDNVWRSTDLGATWTDVSGTGATSLPNVPVRGFAVSWANPNMLYAGTEVGVFVSEDAGTTWLLPNQAPSNVSVDELFWHNGDLVAVTHGRGIYKTRTPLFVTNARSGGGFCNPPPAEECACWGAWSCPCTWATNRVPNQFDDVVVSCPVTGGGNVRNLRNNERVTGTVTAVQGLYNSGTLDGGVIAGDLLNLGTIANLTSQDVIANQLYNAGLISVRDVKVQGVNGPGSIQAGNGNLANFGAMQGRDLYFGVPASVPQPAGNISGNGTFVFQRGVIDIGTSAVLAGSVSFRFGTLLITGVLDVRSNTLTLNGSLDSFSDDSRFRGVIGNGLVQFAPTTIDGRARLVAEKQFLPSVRILSGEVNTYVYGNLLGIPAALGPVTVDNGAIMSADTAIKFGGNVLVNGSLAVDSGCPICTPDIDFNGDTFTNNGSVGAVRFFRFNASGTAPLSQRIVGTGTWAPRNLQIGGNAPSTSILSLANDVVFSSTQLQIFPGSTLDLTTTDGTTRTFSLNAAANVFNYGNITGNPGRFMLQPATGTTTLFWDAPATLNANLHVAFGTVRMSAVSNDIPIGGDLRVEDGATFTLVNPGISVAGTAQVDGTINTLATLPVSLNFTGSRFTNNGTVTGNNLFTRFLSPNASPVSQIITGTGTWGGTQFYVGNTSTITLQHFFTFTGSTFFLDGRINTGTFSLSIPCNVTWLGSGEVFGTVRRTNLSACTGPVAFGNPFTTIQFTGGTPPSEVSVNVISSPPGGFPGAVARTYLIEPLGGANWTATLRLHYLDSELNGNNEATLNLFRNNGTVWNLQGATARNTTDNWVEYAGVTNFSPWAISSMAPTAASASLSGRVRDAFGRGVSMAVVSATDGRGLARSTRTNTFGYFRLSGLPAGETYVVSVADRLRRFSPRVVLLTDDISGFDFTPDANIQEVLIPKKSWP